MSSHGFGGGYPGGPRRHVEKEESGEPPGFEIRDGESVEAYAATRAWERSRKHRKRRLVIGLLASLVLASSVGVYVGVRESRRHERELEEKMTEERSDLEKEASRLINELWKMEDLERAPRR